MLTALYQASTST